MIIYGQFFKGLPKTGPGRPRDNPRENDIPKEASHPDRERHQRVQSHRDNRVPIILMILQQKVGDLVFKYGPKLALTVLAMSVAGWTPLYGEERGSNLDMQHENRPASQKVLIAPIV